MSYVPMLVKPLKRTYKLYSCDPKISTGIWMTLLISRLGLKFHLTLLIFHDFVMYNVKFKPVTYRKYVKLK